MGIAAKLRKIESLFAVAATEGELAEPRWTAAAQR
jgi:hypothetical protein